MKTTTIQPTPTRRHVTHYAETTTLGHFIKADTYHFEGKYIRSVNAVERGNGFERCTLSLSDNGRSVYRTLEKTTRYNPKRLQEISALDADEVAKVAAANTLTLA